MGGWSRQLLWESGQDGHYPYIVYRRKAELLEMLGEWDLTEAIHRRNLEWLEAHGFRRQAAISRMNLGWIMNRKGLGREGLALLVEAERALETDGTDYDRCNVNNKIGNACYRLGEYRRAEECFERSLELSYRSHDLEQSANAENNLGNVYGDLGDVDRALGHYQRSYQLGEQLHDPYNNGKTAGNIAWCHLAKGDLPQAMEWYQRQAAVAGQCGDKHLLSVAIGNMVAVFLKQGRHQQALEHIEKRLAIAREMGDRRGQSITLSHLAHLNMAQGDLAGAEKHFGQAVALARELDMKYYLAMFRNEQSLMLQQAGRTEEALAASLEAADTAEAIDNAKLAVQYRTAWARMLAPMDPARAAAVLEDLLARTDDGELRADIYHGLFRATGLEQHRLRALELFREASQKTDSEGCRQAIAELEGQKGRA